MFTLLQVVFTPEDDDQEVTVDTLPLSSHKYTEMKFDRKCKAETWNRGVR